MTNRPLLNNVDHHDLCVIVGHSAAYGDAINQALVFPTEFDAVQREYPILFRRDAVEGLQAVALLGLDRDENLFLDERGWNARYIPAIQQRGPFSIGLSPDEGAGAPARPLIHIDLDDPRVGSEAGQPLFLPHGGNSPYLDHVLGVLGAIFDGITAAPALYAALDAEQLLQPVKIEIELSDLERYVLADHLAIDRERFDALGGAALERLHRAGALRLAVLALSSVGNVARLIERKNRKRGAA